MASYYTAMAKLRLSAVLLCILGAVSADYILTVHLASLTNPGHQIVNGDCCVQPPDNQTTCSLPCNTTLRICVREGGHDPTELSCPITELIVAAGNNRAWSTVLPGSWVGSLQLYVTVIHDLTGIEGHLSPGNPVVGNLIDFIAIEQVTLSPSSLSPTPVNTTGRFERVTAEFSFSLTCTFDYHGPLCDVFCPLARNDSLGRYRCDGNGSRVCLEGYRDMNTNCTTCIPLSGCSEMGGYCTAPGECICHRGYTGPTCSDNATSITPSTSLAPFTPSPSTSLPPIPAPSPSTPSSPSSSLSTPSPSTPSSPSPSLPSSSPSTPSPLSSDQTTPLTGPTSVARSQAIVNPSLIPSSSPGLTAITAGVVQPTIVIDPVPTSAPVALSSKTTRPPLPSLLPPTARPVLPSSPPSPDPINIILGVVLGFLLLMILISLAVFIVALVLTYQRRNRDRGRKTSPQIELRSHVDILYNVSATNELPLAENHGSHSDLGQSINELPETYSNPTYSTFLDDSGMFTDETLLDGAEGQSDRATVVESSEKQNLADLEQVSVQSIELRFQDVEVSVGDDLMGSIQQSLSQSCAHNFKQLSVPNEHLDSVDLGSDYAPSFIYADMFIEDTNKNDDEFPTPSLSPDSVLTPVP